MIKASLQADYHYIMLDSCYASITKHLLHPDGDYIWLHRHTPDPSLQWWNSDAPVSPSDVIKGAKVRNMEYDLEMSLDSFMLNLYRFENHGLYLTQLSKPVPDGLWPPSLPDERVEHILMQNGMIAQFHLPHACEIAQFICSDLDHLKKVIEIPEIKALVLD